MQRINVPIGSRYMWDVAAFRAVCGDAFLPNVLLVSTSQGGSPQVEPQPIAKENKMLDRLRTDPRFWKPLLNRGSRLAHFAVADHLSTASALDVLDRLPAIPPSKTLKLQLEAGRNRWDITKTSAWWMVFSVHHRWYCRFRHLMPAWRCICVVRSTLERSKE